MTQQETISWNNLTVLLIDMQNSFIGDMSKRELIPYQKQVLSMCREKQVPVIVLEDPRSGKTISELREEIVDMSKVYTISKQAENGFEETNLSEILIKLGTKNILLMGINACGCVLETAEGAVSDGYKIITSNTLIEGYETEENKMRVIKWYRENGIFIHGEIFPLFQ